MRFAVPLFQARLRYPADFVILCALRWDVRRLNTARRHAGCTVSPPFYYGLPHCYSLYPWFVPLVSLLLRQRLPSNRCALTMRGLDDTVRLPAVLPVWFCLVGGMRAFRGLTSSSVAGSFRCILALQHSPTATSTFLPPSCVDITFHISRTTPALRATTRDTISLPGWFELRWTGAVWLTFVTPPGRLVILWLCCRAGVPGCFLLYRARGAGTLGFVPLRCHWFLPPRTLRVMHVATLLTLPSPGSKAPFCFQAGSNALVACACVCGLLEPFALRAHAPFIAEDWFRTGFATAAPYARAGDTASPMPRLFSLRDVFCLLLLPLRLPFCCRLTLPVRRAWAFRMADAASRWALYLRFMRTRHHRVLGTLDSLNVRLYRRVVTFPPSPCWFHALYYAELRTYSRSPSCLPYVMVLHSGPLPKRFGASRRLSLFTRWFSLPTRDRHCRMFGGWLNRASTSFGLLRTLLTDLSLFVRCCWFCV